MFEREAGYDADNQNWFWVKYKPGGGLDARQLGGKQVPLAGRIAKGNTVEENGGCIYCHSSAGGRDYIFYPSVKRPQRGAGANIPSPYPFSPNDETAGEGGRGVTG